MNIDERKLQILNAIIEAYIITGESVGSKLVAQMLRHTVSPATIRNDMATLFDMGLLEQAHTSAGRTPSHLGYRIYIDEMMRPKDLTAEEKIRIDALFNVRTPDPDKLLEDAATALSRFTGCTTIAATTTPPTVTLKSASIIPAGNYSVALLLIASNGMMKTKICRVDFFVTEELVTFFNKFINATILDKSLDEISNVYSSSISIPIGENDALFTTLLSSIFDLVREMRDGQYYIAGETNLLSYVENPRTAYEMLNFLRQKNKMLHLFQGVKSKTTVIIGRENSQMELSDSTVLITKYKIGKHTTGAVGLIGPVRMDYAHMIPHIEYFAQTLGQLLSETFEERA